MKITLKLFASLTDYLPTELKYTNMMAMDVAPDASILQILAPLAALLACLPLALEVQGDEVDNVAFVVNDQDFQGHCNLTSTQNYSAASGARWCCRSIRLSRRW